MFHCFSETYLKYNQLRRYTKVKTCKNVKENSKVRDMTFYARKHLESTFCFHHLQKGIDDEVFGKSLNKTKIPKSNSETVKIRISPTDCKSIKLRHPQRPGKHFPSKNNPLNHSNEKQQDEPTNRKVVGCRNFCK